MDQYKAPSLLRVAIHLVLAATLLFFGLVSLRLASRDASRDSLYNLAPSLLLFVTPALFFTMRIGWLLRRPSSEHSKARPLWLTLPLSLGVVFLLAVLFVALMFVIHG